MAPEVVEGNVRVPVSDIWSLGCCILELLDGKPPYAEQGEINSLFRLLRDPHPPLPERCAGTRMEDFLLK